MVKKKKRCINISVSSPLACVCRGGSRCLHCHVAALNATLLLYDIEIKGFVQIYNQELYGSRYITILGTLC